ncbi:hypothetical protein ACIPWI_00920 [Streptomyces sp. NPDC090046]|uniref:hypothetical protein n=1 Tax=Streptomyces sp. NPDC090046 TaxID=3365928 RepID=UPI0037F77387
MSWNTLIGIAGIQWKAEEAFQTGLGLAGPVILAHAFLTIAAEQPEPPDSAQMIRLTRNEIAHLLAVADHHRPHPPGHRQHWPRWRRHHQHTAPRRRYQRRQAAPL